MSSSVHGRVVYSAQFRDATGVVGVAVGAEDAAKLQFVFGEKREYRPGFTGIDNNCGRLVMDGPDVIVAKGGDGGNFDHDQGLSGMPDCKTTSESLSAWFDTPQGRYVLAREQAYFDRTVSDIFGFNALQAGLPGLDFLSASRMPLRIRGADTAVVDVLMCCSELPFASDSMDLVVLPHVLEFAEYPHQILREVERVLRPEGSLIISAFNPLSLWGLRRVLGCKQDYPWRGRFITLLRLKDWLALLGFEVAGGRFAVYAPPLHSDKWLERYSFLEKAGDRWWPVTGGVYFLHAVKRVPGMRLIKPKWNKGLVRNLIPSAPKLNNRITQQTEHDEH